MQSHSLWKCLKVNMFDRYCMVLLLPTTIEAIETISAQNSRNLSTDGAECRCLSLNEKDHLAGKLREGFPKKVAVLLNFVQMRGSGGRALPKFFIHVSQTLYIGLIWGWGGRGGDPFPNFLHIGVQKKWYKFSKLGGGVVVIWTKSKRTVTFFWETVYRSF